MGKESRASAMEIDAPKSTSSDQIVPKFSINGLFSPSFSIAVPFRAIPFANEMENTALNSELW